MKRVLALALNLLLIFFLSRALVRMLPAIGETIVAERYWSTSTPCALSSADNPGTLRLD